MQEYRGRTNSAMGENCNVRKALKSADLMEECREMGWRLLLFLVEMIVCKGFPAQLVWRLMTALGMVSSARTTSVRQLAEAAE